MLRHVSNTHQQLTDTSEQTENSFIQMLTEMFGKHVLSAISYSREKLLMVSISMLCLSCPHMEPQGQLPRTGLFNSYKIEKKSTF